MYDYLQLLKDHAILLGEFDPAKVDNLYPQWFWDRRVSLIDFRGDLRFIDSQSITWGFHISAITASHDFSSGSCGTTIIKKVWVEGGSFVGSGAFLYNCHIKPHAVVACGSVVRNITVEPFTMVEGNPARVIKKYIDGAWRKV